MSDQATVSASSGNK